jgi:hypothetical protein
MRGGSYTLGEVKVWWNPRDHWPYKAYIYTFRSPRETNCYHLPSNFLVDGLELYILINFGIKGAISTLVRTSAHSRYAR